MKYPMLDPELEFSRCGPDIYVVEDETIGMQYLMSGSVARFLKKLNGRTDPYRIDPAFSERKVQRLLSELEAHELLRTERVIRCGRGTVYCGLWFPILCPLLKIISKAFNCCLQVLWAPTLAYGIWYFLHHTPYGYTAFSTFAYLLGVLLGMLIHEVSHTCAGFASGAKVSEVGIMVRFYVFFGAYTRIDLDRVTSCTKRVQVLAAGIESNFLLAGYFLLICCYSRFPAVFFSAATANAFLGLLNLAFIPGFDGRSILQVVCSAWRSLGGNREV